jgi:hypothetical protein
MSDTNLLAQYIAKAVNEYLHLIKTMQITDKQVYKFSTKVWFDIEEDKVKSMSISDTVLTKLNKSLIKKVTHELAQANG